MNGYDGWRVRLLDDDTFIRGVVRLAIYRPAGPGRTEVRDKDGSRTVDTPGFERPPVEWIELPVDALEPLRDELSKRAGDHPDSRVEKELRAALDVERGRTDRTLHAYLNERVVMQQLHDRQQL